MHTTTETAATATATTGSATVVLRPLAHGEVDPVEAVFDGMSAHSRELRFHQPRPRLTDPMRRVLTDVDGARHVAVVAEAVADGRREAVGIGRLIATGGGTAELAFAVVDAWHCRGVGRRLLTALVRRAADLGHRRLLAYVRVDNLAAVRLLRSVLDDVAVGRDGMALVITAPVRPAPRTGRAARAHRS